MSADSVWTYFASVNGIPKTLALDVPDAQAVAKDSQFLNSMESGTSYLYRYDTVTKGNVILFTAPKTSGGPGDDKPPRSAAFGVAVLVGGVALVGGLMWWANESQKRAKRELDTRLASMGPDELLREMIRHQATTNDELGWLQMTQMMNRHY